MGQVLHGNATTTEAIRRTVQNSQESLRALSKRYGINQKTVAKWRKRASTAELPTVPKEAKSTFLSVEEEAVIVALRRYTLLLLDDCLLCAEADYTVPDPVFLASLPATLWHQPPAASRQLPAGCRRPPILGVVGAEDLEDLLRRHHEPRRTFGHRHVGDTGPRLARPRFTQAFFRQCRGLDIASRWIVLIQTEDTHHDHSKHLGFKRQEGVNRNLGSSISPSA